MKCWTDVQSEAPKWWLFKYYASSMSKAGGAACSPLEVIDDITWPNSHNFGTLLWTSIQAWTEVRCATQQLNQTKINEKLKSFPASIYHCNTLRRVLFFIDFAKLYFQLTHPSLKPFEFLQLLFQSGRFRGDCGTFYFGSSICFAPSNRKCLELS